MNKLKHPQSRKQQQNNKNASSGDGVTLHVLAITVD